MARPTIRKKDAAPVEEVGVVFENTDGTTEVVFDDTAKVNEENIPKAEKKVRVMTSAYHTCAIGGERYVFEAGKQYNVPENVKSILKKAGILAAI